MKLAIFLGTFLATLIQGAERLPLTIEIKQDVQVRNNYEIPEHRGVLYLEDAKTAAFQIKKGQHFQMVRIGKEGSCRIRFENKEYGLRSCPWLDGFRDHQADIFSVDRKR